MEESTSHLAVFTLLSSNVLQQYSMIRTLTILLSQILETEKSPSNTHTHTFIRNTGVTWGLNDNQSQTACSVNMANLLK